jgi:hypothetical protein
MTETKTIMERAQELAAASVPPGYAFTIQGVNVAQACAEWQATVEQRLREIEQHPALSIPPMRSNVFVGLPGVPISDPGPSKYDGEPVETEE